MLLAAGFICLGIAFSAPVSESPASPVAVEQIKGPTPLAENAQFLLDPVKTVTIADVGSIGQQNEFLPLAEGLPLRSSGALWLRFSLIKNILSVPVAPSTAAQPGDAEASAGNTVLLALGKTAPKASIWLPRKVEGQVLGWGGYVADKDNNFSLSAPSSLPMTVYLRLDSAPDLWFNPVLLPDSAQRVEFLPVTLMLKLILLAALAACLLRAVLEKAQWRLWAGLFILTAFLQALNPYFGRETAVTLGNFFFFLLPGLNFMLLSHLGRHMLQAPAEMPRTDKYLLALLIPGAVAALLPLVPGLIWVTRLAPLAPFLFLLMLPVALHGLLKGRPGSFGFFCATFLPLLGAAASALELVLATAVLGPSGGLWGFALAGLVLALCGAIRNGARLLHADAGEEAGIGQGSLFLHEPLPRFAEEPEKTLEESVFFVPDGAEERETEAETPAALQGGLDFGAYAEDDSAGPAGQRFDGWSPKDMELPEGFIEQLPAHLRFHKPQDLAAAAPVTATDEITPSESASPAAESENILALEDKVAEAEGKTVSPEADSDPSRVEHAQSPAPAAAKAMPEGFSAMIVREPGPEGVRTEAPIGPDEAGPMVIRLEDEEGDAAEIPGRNIPSPAGGASVVDYMALARVENALRTPYEALLRGFEVIRSYKPGQFDQENELEYNHLEIMSEGLSNMGSMLENLDRIAVGQIVRPVSDQTVFNLHLLVRQCHAQVQPLAESKGVGVSWFISPYLPQLFRGYAEKLKETLTLLLFDAVGATASGAVQLSIRPEQGKPGLLAFTLTDSGTGVPPVQRPTTGLLRAWELAGYAAGKPFAGAEPGPGGTFALEFAPGNGMQLKFSIVLDPVLEEDDVSAIMPAASLEKIVRQEEAGARQGEKAVSGAENMAGERSTESEPGPFRPEAPDGNERPYVILADMAASTRRRLNEFLEGLSYIRVEARNIEDIILTYQKFPAGLIILDGNIPEMDIGSVLKNLEEIDEMKGLGRAAVLALITYPAQRERMLALGCGDSLLKPFSREDLREAVTRLLPLGEEPDWSGRADESAASGDVAPQVWLAKISANRDESVPEAGCIVSIAADLAQAREEERGGREEAEETRENALEAEEVDGAKLPPVEPACAQAAEISETGVSEDYAEPEILEEAPEVTETVETREEAPAGNLIDFIVDETEPEKEEGKRTPSIIIPPAFITVKPQAAPVAENAAPLSLPGIEGETVDPRLEPTLPGFTVFLEESLRDLLRGREASSPLLTQETAATLAGRAEIYGLRGLANIARCVERAASGNDMAAVNELFSELEETAGRYLKALKATLPAG